MPDGTHAPQIGDNRGPPFNPETVDKLAAEVTTFTEAAGQWLDRGPLTSEEEASKLNDYIAGVKAKAKAVDEVRKDAKRPHDEAAKAVQDAFKPILDRLDRAAKRVQPLLSAFLQEQDRKRREEIKRQEEEARKAREEAARLAAQAEARNDVDGEIAAEEARIAAEAQEKAARQSAKARANVKSASGGGRTASLRTYYTAEVTNTRAAFMHYAEHPDLLACLKALAEREARSKGFDPETDRIPGCTITVEKRAV